MLPLLAILAQLEILISWNYSPFPLSLRQLSTNSSSNSIIWIAGSEEREREGSCIQISLVRQACSKQAIVVTVEPEQSCVSFHFTFLSLSLSFSWPISHATRSSMLSSLRSTSHGLFSFYCDPCTVKRNPRNRRRDLNPQPVVDYHLSFRNVYIYAYIPLYYRNNKPCAVLRAAHRVDRWKVDKMSAEANEPGTRESSSSRAPNRAPC